METTPTNPPAFYPKRHSLFRQPWVRYTLLFIAGLCAGAVGMLWINPSQPTLAVDGEDVRGTIYNSSSYDKMKPADAIFFDQPNLRAAIQVRYSTKLVEARMNLSSTASVKLQIEFGYTDFRVLNVHNLTGGDQSTILSGPNSVQIENIGENEYIIQWANLNQLPHHFIFRFIQNDVPFYTNSVQVNQE